MADEIYGDGSDGAQTFSADTSISGVKQYTDLTIQSGVTVTCTDVTVLHATGSIQIDGTLTAAGQGAPGGDGGFGGADDTDATDGDPGGDGAYEGAGGDGSGGTGGTGAGSGGAGGTATGSAPSETVTGPLDPDDYLGDDAGWTDIYALTPTETGSGGGGGGGGYSLNAGANTGDGGDGGPGGGLIALLAPSISVAGTLSAAGADGADGGYGDESGGGGGGGSGGAVWTITEGSHPSADVSGGVGGAGGEGNEPSYSGEDGDDGTQYALDVAISTPGNFAAVQGGRGELDLSWDTVAEADEYRLYRATSPGTDLADYTQIATITDGSQSAHTDTGLEDGRQYHYRLVAATGTEVLASWGAEADWDAAAKTNIGVVGGTFQLAEAAVTSIDSFEAYSTGSPPGGNWTTPTSISADVLTSGYDGASAIDGSNVLSFSGDPGNDARVAIWDDGSTSQPTEIQFAYHEASTGQTGVLLDVRDGSGNRLFKMGTNNPQVEVWADSGQNVLLQSPSPDYDEWRRMTATIDWGAGTFDVLWEDLTGSSSDQSQTGYSFLTPNDGNAGSVGVNSDEGGGSAMSCSVDVVTVLGSI